VPKYEVAFAKAWAEGRLMTMEQAIEYALDNQGGWNFLQISYLPSLDQNLIQE
jgi:hypothetical protein